mmetsp:Transcript_305/g.999  ORF Transcript_305/g.999 Transcript_305/m.999 type:complete len:320 (+) Transcript_305:103-1062(+)|eukprot:CAMPEP_0198731354 /NCGR_PEP_ID=MMETSP1475-20131203/29284_1 /TAXON_ID= ORGANISM="Unidentified sp., Strain CCMP1999" /NCGR_SAMPLE_ID=MMETSP1475 /ASSEMBLY_ACC=CAM_ASM_001111 /LENGTH=319 /DNA_ID=CAMNT_0044494311 /DNA_START=42 /DNA_END=1001 /DNA_ORIENTATION=+
MSVVSAVTSDDSGWLTEEQRDIARNFFAQKFATLQKGKPPEYVKSYAVRHEKECYESATDIQTYIIAVCKPIDELEQIITDNQQGHQRPKQEAMIQPPQAGAQTGSQAAAQATTQGMPMQQPTARMPQQRPAAVAHANMPQARVAQMAQQQPHQQQPTDPMQAANFPPKQQPMAQQYPKVNKAANNMQAGAGAQGQPQPAMQQPMPVKTEGNDLNQMQNQELSDLQVQELFASIKRKYQSFYANASKFLANQTSADPNLKKKIFTYYKFLTMDFNQLPPDVQSAVRKGTFETFIRKGALSAQNFHKASRQRQATGAPTR